MRIPCSLAILLSVIMTPCKGQSQSHAWPLDEWKEKLSVRKDPGFVKLEDVIAQIEALDSVERCRALELLEQREMRGNARMKIRFALVWAQVVKGTPDCRIAGSVQDALEIALRKCYEIADHVLAASVHKELGEVYYAARELGLSVTHYLLAKELMEKEGLNTFRDYAFTVLTLADRLYHSRDYRSSAKLIREAIAYRGTGDLNNADTLSNYWEMNAWNNLGLCYVRLGVYDSAFYAFNNAYTLADGPFWQGLILGNRGDVFFYQGRYDSAEVLLQYDYDQSLASKEYHNAALTLVRLAHITHSRGDLHKAIAMVREADALERRRPYDDYRVHILYTYALIYRDLGMADSAFAYMEYYKAMSEKIEKHAAENRTEIIRLRLGNLENINAIQALVKDKHRIVLIRNFTILVLLILAATGYLYLNRLRLRSQLKHRKALEEKRKAESEALQAKEQLKVYTQNLREKTTLIENLQNQLLRRETNEAQIKQITELSQHVILTDEDWDRFKLLFDKVYPGFLISLKRKSSDITLAELRMAALSKLQLNIKECASLLGISPNSVHKTRYRLKQRLGLDHDDDLEAYITSSDKFVTP